MAPPKSIQVNGAKSASPPANQTLYVSNLDDRIQKHDLRRSLYTLFSTYGTVLDIVSLKTAKMRGQAHIVFRDTQTSTQAMRALQGFELFGKEMRISYAKGKSDMISRLDGTSKMPDTKAESTVVADAQKAIFNNPSLIKSTAPATGGSLKPPAEVNEGARSPQGVKRTREDESEDEDGTAMDQDDEDDAMEESDED